MVISITGSHRRETETKEKRKKKDEEDQQEGEQEDYISQADAMKESVKQHSEETTTILIEPLLSVNLKDVVALRFWIVTYSYAFTLSQQLQHFCMDKRFSEGHAMPLGEQVTLDGNDSKLDQELRDIQKNFVASLKEPMNEDTLNRCLEEYITSGCARASDIKTRYTGFIKEYNSRVSDEDRSFALADVAFSPSWAMHINVRA